MWYAILHTLKHTGAANMSSEQFAQRVQEYIAEGMSEQLAWHTAVEDELYMTADAVDSMLIEQFDTEEM